ncbi:MAG: glycoside hydrolase family 3 [Chloroflexi bacterium]|nr:glycoside hydrolase family 3 [Chloroflexota bacterium]
MSPAGPLRPRPPEVLSRRSFLRLAGAAVIAMAAAACADAASGSPAPAGSGSPGATASPSTTRASPTIVVPAGPDLRTKIAQMLLVGFRGLTVAQAATTVVDIRERGLGGVLLFDTDGPSGSSSRNVASPAQLRTLVAGLRAVAHVPLLVAIDEEGGEVDRLTTARGFPATVSAAALGTRDNATYTRQRARAIGKTLAAAGIDLDLAPVVDVDVNPTSPAIGALERSFSADPAVVTRQGLAFLAGLHDAGVAGTIKHFPGHGSSTADSHLGWVDVTTTWTPAELEPFRAIVAAGAADAVLVAHVFDAKLDRTYPASLSSAVIDGLLRTSLGFEGVVLSDDLQMGALRKVYGYETAVERAILAGTDILTIANQQLYDAEIVETTIAMIAESVAAGRITEARIDASWRRIAALKTRYHGAIG